MIKNLSIISFISIIMMGCVGADYYMKQIESEKKAKYDYYEECLRKGDSFCACKLAELYYNDASFGKAKEYFEKCYKNKMVNQSIDWQNIVPGHMDIGAGIYYKLGEYKKALEAILAFQRLRATNSYWSAHWGEYFLKSEALFYWYLVDCYVKTGQWDLAIENGKKLISLQPDWDGAYNMLGVAYFAEKQYHEAITAFKRALEFKPNNAIYHSNLADCYYRLKQYNEALSIYNKALSINPNNFYPYSQIAKIYYEKGDYEQEINTWERLAKLSSDSTVYHNIAMGYLRLGKFNDGLSSLNKAIELISFTGIGGGIKIIEGYPVVVKVMEGGPAKKAGIEPGDKIIKIDGEETKKWTGDKTSQKLRGREGTKVRLTIERKGLSNPIEKTVERAKLTLKIAGGPLGLRSLIYALKGDFEKADKDAEMAYSLDANSINAKQARAFSYIMTSPPLAKEGKIMEAIKILSTIKDDNFSRLLEALAYAKMGDLKKSAEIFESIPEEYLLSKDAFLQHYKNAVLESLVPYVESKKENVKALEAKGQYKEALKEYADLLKMADKNGEKEIRIRVAVLLKNNPYLKELPEEARRHALRAEVLTKEGKFEEAVKEYKKGIRIAPFFPVLYKAISLNYAELKEYQKAIENMTAYLELFPDAPDGRAARDEIYKWEFMREKGGKY